MYIFLVSEIAFLSIKCFSANCACEKASSLHKNTLQEKIWIFKYIPEERTLSSFKTYCFQRVQFFC